MRKIKQRRYRAGTWREILRRFEDSGLGAAAFCARERVSVQSLRRWQSRLGGETEHALVAKTEGLTDKTAEFIDLGALRSGEPRLEVRLELGGGVILSIARS